MLPEAVSDYLESHWDHHLDGLLEFLRFPSVANDRSTPDPCARCAAWLAGRIQSLGLPAEVIPTAGKPAVLAGDLSAGEGRPTLLAYAHYDVQPPDPLDQWESDPFEPAIRDGAIHARGASDDKGPLWAILMAVEAWRQAGGGLPVNLKLFFEGEEEVGSPNVEAFLEAYRDRLGADAAVVADSLFFARDLPSITYGLRGICYFEVTFSGPGRDLHSGSHGGPVANPAMALAAMVAALHDSDGRVTIDGFYDDVEPVTDAERQAWAGLPFDERKYAASLGVSGFAGGERGLPVLERLWGRPTVECNGIHGGYTGPGSKTIIPASASAKISMRLVPRQDPPRIVDAFRTFVAEHTPAGIRSDAKVFAAARPVLVPPDSDIIRIGRDAMREAFGRDAALVRCGASVPVTEVIRRILGADPLVLGVGLPDDNLHAPNEKYELDMLRGVSRTMAALLGRLAEDRQ